MSSDMGWIGKRVRNSDGRTGRIVSEYQGFMHANLKIAVDGGGEAFIQFNSNSKDSGETGWSYLCPYFDPVPSWLPLGDHSGVPVVRA